MGGAIMDKNLEKQLRKTSFVVMAKHHLAIRGAVDLSVSDICYILKVTRPTAKAYMISLIDAGKATGMCDKRGRLYILVHFNQWTTKEMDSAKMAYDNLIWELSR